MDAFLKKVKIVTRNSEIDEKFVFEYYLFEM